MKKLAHLLIIIVIAISFISVFSCSKGDRSSSTEKMSLDEAKKIIKEREEKEILEKAISIKREERIPKANAIAKSDLKNAFTAAQAYFSDHENGIVNESILTASGYTKSKGVTLTISKGTIKDLELSTRHNEGDITYFINADGAINP